MQDTCLRGPYNGNEVKGIARQHLLYDVLLDDVEPQPRGRIRIESPTFYFTNQFRAVFVPRLVDHTPEYLTVGVQGDWVAIAWFYAPETSPRIVSETTAVVEVPKSTT